MIFQGVEICCPDCRGELEDIAGKDQARLHCSSCGREYPLFQGIPDLRIFPDPYLSVEDDRQKALELAAHFEELDFAGLVACYYQGKKDVPPQQIRQYTRGILAGIARAQAALASWGGLDNGNGRTGKLGLLEIGCGTAPMLVAASQAFRMVGVDIGLRWLILGKKRLVEAGLDIPLFCACAEALPFPDEAFDGVIADSVIENVRDQRRALGESWRVMRAHGRLWMSTPNRYSLGPDPHAGLWGGGYLPDRWLAAYVRRQGGIPPRRNLLSSRSLPRLIREAGFSSPRTFLPDVPEGQRAQFGGVIQALIDGYQFVKHVPGGRQLLMWIGPTLHAVAEKP